MRMSDTANGEATKLSDVPNLASLSPREHTTTSEVSDQSQSCKDEHSSKTKRDNTTTTQQQQSSTRLKLVRSLAVCEESFPCSIPESSAAPQDGFSLQTMDKDERVDKEDVCDKVDKPEKMQKKCLSRDSSQDYTDSTGIDLHEFLVNTLKSNPRDRIMLLKLEQDILDFISNNDSQKRKFPPMTAYHRMLLHRVAAYFGMDHNVDPSGKSVVINKTTNTRIPDQKFSEHIKDDRVDDFQKRYILKRDNSSFDREDSAIRMRLKADKRSKSMEEREEEYQRARERIFAHDGDHFILDRSLQDEDSCLSTQQRRQMFRLRAGRSAASRQSSSETETLSRHGEPRPWSSTDSSDSSNRLAPRPAITKASSFSGISPGLVRGDSTASSKSTDRLSKTGSESCSSVGSSSSSLSRPQLPLPVSVSSRSNIINPPLIHPTVNRRGPGFPEMMKMKNVPSQPPLQPPATEATNYYVFPLEASGIPPGSVLVNPHTGKPFLHPDGSTVVFNPANIVPVGGRSTQQGKHPQQPISAAAGQQQPTNHLHSQPIICPLQSSSEPVHNPTVSYPPLPPPPSLPPSQFLPICTNQQFTVPDILNSQFSHMTLTQHQHSDGRASTQDARHYPTVYHHSPPVMVQGPPPPPPPPPQQVNYVLAGPSGGHSALLQGHSLPTPAPNHAYPSSTPGFPTSTINQPLLQQHAYIQQPLQQMSTCYCSSSHHPNCSTQQQQQHQHQQQQQLQHQHQQQQQQLQQQFHRLPVNPLSFNCPQSQNLPQQQVHQAVMPASSYQTVVGIQPTPNLTLSGNQQSNMGNQMQGMMVQYSPLQTYQQVSVPQQTYQQPVFVSCQPGQSPMPPCYSLLPPNQHTTLSSTVSFLPATMMEPLQFPHTSTPCVSQQHPGQQYAGLLPAPPGGSSSGAGGGVVMLQMTAPSCQQPRAPSPCQRKQSGYKHPGHEHLRGRRPTDLPLQPLPAPPLLLENVQSSLPSSPALSPSPGRPSSTTGRPSGLSPIPVLAPPPQLHTAFCHSGQGEAHISLLGQPLHYKPNIRPSLLHTAHVMTKHQGSLGVWRGSHGRKTSRKSLSSDLS